MARRLHQTLADYVVIAISPALIMALVGSLVFFLLGVFYQGEFQARLYWVMACFVFAAVLIGRISIEEGLERAMPFGAALAILVAIATSRVMEFRGGWIDQFSWLINWSLIALIWWSAHRLTWDCTVIDDDEDSSGEGLLQVAGLEKPASPRDRQAELERELEGTTSRAAPAGLWQRYVQHQRRPHAPGVWVVYFSLAALPLFGIGQWFIPESDVTGRRAAFWLLVVYVAAGIGLLLTTSFLGLRRYLRQRRIEMPTLMANLWLGTGAAVIVGILAVCALLPRPSPEYTISQLPVTLGSPEQQGSRHAPIAKEGARNDEQQGPAQATEGQLAPQDAEPTDQASSGEVSPQQGDGPSTSKTSGQSDAGDSRTESGNSSAKGKQSGGQSTDQGRQARSSDSSQGQQSADNSNSHGDRSPAGRTQSEIRSADGSASHAADQTAQAESGTQPPAEADAGKPAGANAPATGQAPSSAANQLGQALQAVDTGASAVASGLADLLKWAFYAAFALAVLYFVWRFHADILAAIRDFLAGLRAFFGGSQRKPLAGAEPLQLAIPPAPFSSFADPFATGVAGRYPLAELVRYSFEAFEAWSREHDCPRPPDCTPHELANDVARRHAFVASEARGLAELYARAAYARGELPDTTRAQLESLWRKLRQSAPTSN